MPIREIVRKTGIARNTIRKYLSNKVVEPKYPNRKTPSKLYDYASKLMAWPEGGCNPRCYCVAITHIELHRATCNTIEKTELLITQTAEGVTPPNGNLFISSSTAVTREVAITTLCGQSVWALGMAGLRPERTVVIS